MKKFLFVGLLFIFLCSKCKVSTHELQDFGWKNIPKDNEMSAEKIALGRKLFFDKRLSIDNSISCASCHQPRLAFTDGLKTSNGVYHQKTTRNAPSLLNSVYLPTVMFDAHLKTLELQVIVPIQEPTEMGIEMGALIQKLRKVSEYQQSAKVIFNRDFDPWVLTRSISAFERSLISQNSRYDQYVNGKKNALDREELRGLNLFRGKANCFSCHPAPHFTTYQAENNGLYLDYGEDKGRYRITGDSSSIGKFKIPSLRNVALTAPYMHDGSIESLDAVVEHYNQGAKPHFNKHRKLVNLNLSDREKRYLVKFLKSLTDTSYLSQFQDVDNK